MTTTLSAEQQQQALDLVANWLGPRMGHGQPCGTCVGCTEGEPCWTPVGGTVPTGPEAAWKGLGPELKPEWDWPTSGPTPSIVLEGGPYDWAIDVSLDDAMIDRFREIGLYGEPYSGWALCLYAL